jgi:hypothetical protein
MSQDPAFLWSQAAVHCSLLPARVGTQALHAPFDALRWVHAASVRAGLIHPSLRESAGFENALAALEQAALGPLARRV